MNIRELRKLTGLNQSGLAKLAGVSHVAVTHWFAGNTRPVGINRATIGIALIIARVNPDILLACIDIASPNDPLESVTRFFGTDAGLWYWLDIPRDALHDERNRKGLGRLAVLLGITAAMMPNVAAQLVTAYPGIVQRARQAQIEAATARDKRIKDKRNRKNEVRRHLRDNASQSDVSC